MVDSCMPTAFGNVLEDHRPHVLVTVLEEGLLALDDGARDLDERFVADFQALQQPPGFLQLGAHGRVTRVAPDEARIAVVEADFRQGGGVDFHRPTVIGPPHEYVRNDILGRACADC